jgi:hypothetical protein
VLHPEEAMILQKVGLELPPTLIMLSYETRGISVSNSQLSRFYLRYYSLDGKIL